MQPGDDQWYGAMYLVRHLAPDDRVREYHHWALENLPPKSKILDLGCGEGAFVNYAAEQGFDAWGLDFSEAMINAAKTRYPKAKFFVGTLDDFIKQHPGEKFDAVAMFEVVEHLSDPLKTINDTRGILAPGGSLLFSVPNRDRWPISDFGDNPPNHLTFWNETSLSNFIKSSGFDLRKIELTGRLFSMNALFSYCLTRFPLYAFLGLKSGYEGKTKLPAGKTKTGGHVLKLIKKQGPFLRRARDLALWIPTLLFAPLVLPFTRGFNFMVLSRLEFPKPGDQT